MKTIRFLFVLVLLSLANSTFADNLSVEPITIGVGETKEVTIALSNPGKQYAAFQFDLLLPAGVSLATDAKGQYAVSLDSKRAIDHTLNVKALGNNSYRILAYSMTSAVFTGNNGAMVHLTLQAAASASVGEKTASITGQTFTEASENQVKLSDVSFTVNVFLADHLSAETVSMNTGESKVVTIALTNPSKQYAAFQFDVVLPEGITLAKDAKGQYVASLVANRAADHTLNVKDRGSNTYRILAFSMTNAAFTGKSGALVRLTLQAAANTHAGEKTVNITGQTFTDALENQVKLNDASFVVDVLSFVAIKAEDKTRAYGEDNPAWTYAITAGAISGNGVPTMSCKATPKSPVGKYDITIEKGTVENPCELTKGTLTVTKAPLTITAKSYSIKQGEALPTTYEITYSGFKNGETKSVLTKQPKVTCSATAASESGRYDIIVSGATADNYAITYVKGTLRIRSLVAEPGDLNDDGEVDVTDVVELIDMVLAGIYDPAGDINGDGEVDVTDVVELIDMVLNGE